MVKQLSFNESEKLLKKYKIPIPHSTKVKTKKQALATAKKLKYPVVLKVSSEKILHKSDIGGVRINIQTSHELEGAYEVLRKKTDEIVIQEMIEGTYVFVGMKRDPTFGPVIAFGMGGVFVEIIDDVALRIAPVSKQDAKEMIKSIKGYPILKGARGNPKVNIDTLANIIVQTSKLAIKETKIKELDLNPIIIKGKSAKAVDMRLLL